MKLKKIVSEVHELKNQEKKNNYLIVYEANFIFYIFRFPKYFYFIRNDRINVIVLQFAV